MWPWKKKPASLARQSIVKCYGNNGKPYLVIPTILGEKMFFVQKSKAHHGSLDALYHFLGLLHRFQFPTNDFTVELYCGRDGSILEEAEAMYWELVQDENITMKFIIR